MKHVVALSGGKDSTALALALREREPREYEYLFTPTGNELPELFGHIERLEALLGARVTNLHAQSLADLCRANAMLPNFRARWCTRTLKIEPAIAYVQSLPPGSTLYVGLRADEAERKGIYGEDIAIRFPMREWGWTLANVWTYLAQRGVAIPRRTDCALCFNQRVGEWWNLWKDHPGHFAEGVALEAEFGGHTFRTPGRDSWPVALADLGAAFAAGAIPRGASSNGELFEGATCRVCTL